MAINLPNLRNLVFDREGMPSLDSLGIDLSNLPTIDPVTPPPLPSTPFVDKYKKLPLGSTGYVKPNVTTEESQLSLTPGPGLLPYQPFGKDGPILYGTQEQIDAAKAKKSDPITEAVAKALGAASGEASGLGPLGTSGIAMMEDEPITRTSDSTSPMSPMVEPEVTPMDSDIDRMVERALKEAMASGDVPVQAADDPILTIDPVQAAVDAAVGNGQPTTDDTILNLDDMTATSGLRDAIDNAEREESKNPFGFGGENYYSGEGFIPPPEGSMNTMAIVNYYNPSTGQVYRTSSGGYTAPPGWISGTKEDYEGNKEYYDNILAGQGTDTGGTDTGTQQPDFMTQLQELIAQMQAEQTAAAEAQAAQQQQAAEMAQNYMVGQPAVGYNPYQSGQYQNNPYGAAGVPDMGGITSIPVPAAYTPNPYLIGGTT